MADDDNLIKISIVLDDGSVREGFARIKQSGAESAGGIGEAFSTLKKELLGLFIVKETFDMMKEGFSEAIHNARESEKAVQSLNIALGVSGHYTEAASKQFQDLADHLQDTTTVSGDTVLGVERLALAYSKNNAQAMQLTKVSVDMATVLGTDVNSALQQLSGTLSGSAGRLQKLFPDLQQFTAAQLKAGAAVEYFNSKFAGAASAQTNTFDGQLKQMKNSFDDLLKSFGNLVTSSPAVMNALKSVTVLIRSATDTLKTSFAGQDIFKDLIINFSVIAQAGTETARRIGLSFELAYLRAKEAWLAFKVLSTAGFSEAFNKDLQAVMDEIESVKQEFTQDSSITKWFDDLILKVGQSSVAVKTAFQDLGTAHDELNGKNYTLYKSFQDVKNGSIEAAQEMADHVSKSFRQIGDVAVKSLSNGIAQGMAAIGKALVKGEDIFSAFAKALLAALGQAAIQMGSMYILMGIARAWSSYGLDATAWELIGVGSAMAVLGGALMAMGGTSGGSVSTDTGSSSGGGGSSGSFPTGAVGDPASNVSQGSQSRVNVVIQGSVFDTQETGLRIVDIINGSFDGQGAAVRAT